MSSSDGAGVEIFGSELFELLVMHSELLQVRYYYNINMHKYRQTAINYSTAHGQIVSNSHEIWSEVISLPCLGNGQMEDFLKKRVFLNGSPRLQKLGQQLQDAETSRANLQEESGPELIRSAAFGGQEFL